MKGEYYKQNSTKRVCVVDKVYPVYRSGLSLNGTSKKSGSSILGYKVQYHFIDDGKTLEMNRNEFKCQFKHIDNPW